MWMILFRRFRMVFSKFLKNNRLFFPIFFENGVFLILFYSTYFAEFVGVNFYGKGR